MNFFRLPNVGLAFVLKSYPYLMASSVTYLLTKSLRKPHISLALLSKSNLYLKPSLNINS